MAPDPQDVAVRRRHPTVAWMRLPFLTGTELVGRAVTVVGDDLVGLTTALAAHAAGASVRITTLPGREPTPSGADGWLLWYPLFAGSPTRAVAWARVTAGVLAGVLVPDRLSGCQAVQVQEYLRQTPPTWWTAQLPGIALLPQEALRAPYTAGVDLTSYTAEAGHYQRYLTALCDAGGIGVLDPVSSVTGAFAFGDAVIDCSGDAVDQARPVPAAEISASSGFIILPHGDDVSTLGATACVAAHQGPRPARPGVHLSRQPRAEGVVVTNYGHGAAAFTLAWGCAATAVQLLAG